MTKSISLKIILLALIASISNQTMAQSKITPPQLAPSFSITDVNGAKINLTDYRGKKVMLCFFRNVGCPICNLRFHELQDQSAYFKEKGLVVLAVYESSAENMTRYLTNESFYATMIPNPDQSLYQLFAVERSMGKVMKAMFNGAMEKKGKGEKLFKTKMKQDGNLNRINADFLIDENGKVQTAYYGKYVGDHLPIENIKQFLN